MLGRVDDVINVAGHRIGTMEVESALVDHPKVAEAAVVGRLHEMKGQAISAFVILKEGNAASPALVAELKEHVVKKIGSIARPEDILFVADVPKTRSGKIMRRLLKRVRQGRLGPEPPRSGLVAIAGAGALLGSVGADAHRILARRARRPRRLRLVADEPLGPGRESVRRR